MLFRSGQPLEDYVFGFLRAHPDRAPIPEAQALAIQKAHLAHLDKMAKDGALVGAGPLGTSPDLRGILIFRGITLDRARELASQDPAVVNKRLRVHVEGWKARRGIGEPLAAAMKADPDFKITMKRYGFLVFRKTAAAPADARFGAAQQKLAEHKAWLVANAPALAAAGPFAASREFLGVAIFHSTDLDELGKLAAGEPFTKAGWARPEALTLLIAEGVLPEPAKP